MIEIHLVVRGPGRTTPDYSLKFAVPTLPRPGDYISVHRPDKPAPYSEDCIVRHVWWRLEHPETAAVIYGRSEKIGSVEEIFVECDPALGPYASDAWRDNLESMRERGIIPEFEVQRFSVREKDLKWASVPPSSRD